MKSFLKKIQKIKKPLAVFAILLLATTLILPRQAVAGPLMDGTADLLSAIINWITGGIGWILVFFFDVLLKVAQFTNFVDANVVTVGWPIVRDICNMFFILGLLIIAFSTILGINNNWKKELPKLLMAAVLINFSKTIAGLMIDASQIFMLTFVNAVGAAGAGNFSVIFDVGKYSSMETVNNTVNASATSTTVTTATSKLSLLAGTIAAFAAVMITLVITVVMIAAFVMRIVKLWAYLILSPLPYLLSCFSGGKTYANQWWSEFTKELVGGPVLAFFLWLALTIGANSGDYAMFSGVERTEMNTITALFSNGPFQRYIMVVAFLVLGLQMASKAGGTFGQWAGTGSKWVNNGANFAKKKTTGAIKSTAMFGARTVSDGIGLTGAYIAAKNIKEQYKKNYKNAREERVAASTDKWASGYAGAAGVLSMPAKWLKDKHNSEGKLAQKAREEAALASGDVSRLKNIGYETGTFKNDNHAAVLQHLREEDNSKYRASLLETEETDFNNAQSKRRTSHEFEYGGEKFSFNNGVWASADGTLAISDAEMDGHVKGLHQRRLADINTSVSSLHNLSDDELEKTDAYKDEMKNRHAQKIESIEKSVAQKRADAELHQNAQNDRDDILKMAKVVGGGSLAMTVPFGIPAVLAMAGLNAGAKGALDVKSAADKAASTGRQERVKKKMDDMKDDSQEKVLSTLNNSQKSSAERMAALLVASKNDWVDKDEVRAHKAAFLKEDYFGGDKSEGGVDKFKDEKIENFFAANTSKHMGNEADLVRAFDNKATPEEKQRSIGSLMDQIVNGSLKMEKLSGERLQQAADMFADALNPGEFKKQMDALPQGIKGPAVKAIEEGIKQAELEGNLRKAAAMKKNLSLYSKRPDKYYKDGPNGAFTSEQAKFGSSMTKGYYDAMKKSDGVTPEQIESNNKMLAAAINEAGGSIKKLNPTMQELLKQKKGLGDNLKKELIAKYKITINIDESEKIDNEISLE